MALVEVRPMHDVRGKLSVGVWCVLIFGAGCLRVMTLDYQPSNTINGQGTVHVEPFRYQAADEGRVRPREIETVLRSEGGLFLADPIGNVLKQALEMELTRSGYTVGPSGDRSVSGIVTRFAIESNTEPGRKFELQATYLVQSEGTPNFSWTCTSVQSGPAMFQRDTLLIKAGIADCLERFLKEAKSAQVL
jgi:hypothetical protein